MTGFKNATEKLTKRRTQIKRRISIRINSLKNDSSLNMTAFKRHEVEIDRALDEVKELNSRIEEACIDLDCDVEAELERDMTSECEFSNRIIRDMALLEIRSKGDSESQSRGEHNNPSQHNTASSDFSLRPLLKCATFDGLDCNNKKFKFKNFLMQFENCTAGVHSKATKLQYLLSFLEGYPLQLVQHLSISEDNFDTAIQLLKDEYLDREFIISAIFKQIEEADPKADAEYAQVRHFLAETRANLSELKGSYGLDFLEENSPGNKYLGYSIFSKLPSELKKELIHAVGTNYPTLNHILDKYADVVKTLVITKTRAPSKPLKQPPPDYSDWEPDPYTNSKPDRGRENVPDNRPRGLDIYPKDTCSNKRTALENFATQVGTRSFPENCKFCNADGHQARFCAKYNTLSTRRARCEELKLCSLCTRADHLADTCPGKRNGLRYPCKICRAKSHNAALCSEMDSSKKMAVTTNACFDPGKRIQP